MNKIRFKGSWFQFIPLIFLILIFLVSCAQTQSPPSTSAPSGDGAPKYGGTLRMAVAQAPIGMDPVVIGAAQGTQSCVRVFSEGLAAMTGKNMYDYRIVPGLAKSWDYSADGLTATYHLREGVKFQNIPPANGREMTAEDFKFCFDRMKDPATRAPQRANLDPIDSFSTPDKYTLVIKYNESFPSFNTAASGTASLSVFPPEVVKQDGSLNKTYIGTGPFILKEYVPNVKAVYEKNPEYWDKGKPYLDKVEIIFVADEAQRKAAFRAGQVDVVWEIKNFVNDIQGTNPDAKIVEATSTRGVGLSFSISQNPKLWGDKRVRQALSYAIDYDGLIKAVVSGGGIRSGMFAPWYQEWGGVPVDKLPKRDIAKAKQLLAEAGYPNGFKTTIAQDTGRMDVWGGAVEPVVAMLKEIGIDAEIVPMDSTTFTTNTRAGKFELACVTAATGQPGDLDMTLLIMYSSKGPQNYSKYTNPKIDELLAAERKAYPNEAARKKIFQEAAVILEEEVPIVPLYHQYFYQVKQPWVTWDESADPQNYYGTPTLRTVWMDKK